MEFRAGEINIICTDVEKSLKFYRDVLGFTPEQDEEGFYHLKFCLKSQNIAYYYKSILNYYKNI